MEMPSNIVDPNTLWTDSKVVIKRNTKNGWGKLRIKKHRQTRRDYFDILLGIKGRKDWHTHIGISLNQELLFKEFRDQMLTIGRKIDSVNKGIMEDKTLVIDTSKKPLLTWKFKPSMNGKTSEVIVTEFDIADV